MATCKTISDQPRSRALGERRPRRSWAPLKKPDPSRISPIIRMNDPKSPMGSAIATTPSTVQATPTASSTPRFRPNCCSIRCSRPLIDDVVPISGLFSGLSWTSIRRHLSTIVWRRIVGKQKLECGLDDLFSFSVQGHEMVGTIKHMEFLLGRAQMVVQPDGLGRIDHGVEPSLDDERRSPDRRDQRFDHFDELESAKRRRNVESL